MKHCEKILTNLCDEQIKGRVSKHTILAIVIHFLGNALFVYDIPERMTNITK